VNDGHLEKMGLEKNDKRLNTFEMKRLRKILRVLWTAKITNKWVINKAGVRKELLKTVNAKKLAYNGHTMKINKSVAWRKR